MLLSLCAGLPLDPLPENNKRNTDIAHAAKRVVNLTKAERQVKECLLVYFTFFFVVVDFILPLNWNLSLSSVLDYMITFVTFCKA